MSDVDIDPLHEMDSLAANPSPPGKGVSPASRRLAWSDYTVGICLLLLVVFLWTGSNFVTQVCLNNCAWFP